mmetsp:Transcript_63721/g.201528  ORF Transcript_63721/g.201528 Transcript_63721/m.201528 type:complete len:335 (+) Transcript_63721:154-1158(+)|eukprot:CAMPEP_0182885866 /NCGR_PEP_ID=MMETSP0034_2-20130328/19874_1 /TAXON_ID=156128 /ORGANISM="Nephroselmis pyriformis, Strain CCMP717" /LENGTH=334 /DNA_ID=CAMNT_0025019153 /DNA_START=104 /DNA_END=1108 /DNA_ORIENTATION=+
MAPWRGLLRTAAALVVLAVFAEAFNIPSIFSDSGKADRGSTAAAGTVFVGGKAPSKCHGLKINVLPKRNDVITTISGEDALRKHNLKFDSCAVVGNAGMLQGTRYGAVIDSHAAVIRMNQAPTEGYHNTAGSKATFRIINKEWVWKYAEGHKWLPTEPGLMLVSRNDNEERIARGKYAPALANTGLRNRITKWSAKAKVPVLKATKRLVDASWKLTYSFAPCTPGKVNKCPQCKPSSGIIAVSMALSMCDRVNVYGMGGSRFKGKYPYHYYVFRNTQLKQGYSGHMFETERALVEQLGREGFLTVCTDENPVECSAPSWVDNPCCSQAGGVEGR